MMFTEIRSEKTSPKPQQEVVWVVACDVSQRVGVLKKAQLRRLLGQYPRNLHVDPDMILGVSLALGRWRRRTFRVRV